MNSQVLQLNPILIPAINDALASLYTVHKHFEMTEPEAWLRAHGASIAAVITGGHTGISRAMLQQLPGLKVHSCACMNAIQIQAIGGPEVLQMAELPIPAPGPGQVLIRVEAIGVNFIEIYFRKGTYKATLPLIPGSEAAGPGAGTAAAECRSAGRPL